MKQRASNNRTLLLEDAERPALRALLKSIEDLRQGNPSPWLDAVICADMLEAMRWIPDEMADLIILDPPYNLTRDFGGSSFAARNDQEYEEYLRSWMHTVCQKLKPTGSLYLCGDWRCTAAMQRVLSDELTIPIIASGGAGCKEHFLDVFKVGHADAALAASVFHFGEIPMRELKLYLAENGINVRL